MQTEAMGRDKLFTIRMTEEERVRAERVSARYGLNVAGVIRMLLKREDDLGRLNDPKTPWDEMVHLEKQVLANGGRPEDSPRVRALLRKLEAAKSDKEFFELVRLMSPDEPVAPRKRTEVKGKPTKKAAKSKK